MITTIAAIQRMLIVQGFSSLVVCRVGLCFVYCILLLRRVLYIVYCICL